ncbi:MAG: hypothetical protein IKO83_09905 [Oscillospiraceae bacterium]|nr:hypothetical protein [Oscillospiraceae bacterium]
MSKILYFSTIALNISGVVFSLVYIGLNLFSKAGDVGVRSETSLKIIKASVTWSLIFAFLSCLFLNTRVVSEAIARTSKLYSTIAVSWLAVILACGVSMLLMLASRKAIRSGLLQAIKKLFSVAMTGAIIAMLLSWLLG